MNGPSTDLDAWLEEAFLLFSGIERCLSETRIGCDELMLLQLVKNERGISSGEASRVLGFSPAKTSRMRSCLRGLDLISERVGREDFRRIMLVLTNRGDKVLFEVERLMRDEGLALSNALERYRILRRGLASFREGLGCSEASSSMHALLLLARRGPTMSQAAKTTGFSQPRVSAATGRLHESGLVELQAGEPDARERRIILTGAGRLLANSQEALLLDLLCESAAFEERR